MNFLWITKSSQSYGRSQSIFAFALDIGTTFFNWTLVDMKKDTTYIGRINVTKIPGIPTFKICLDAQETIPNMHEALGDLLRKTKT